MKKRRLKKWVEYTLITINFLSLIVMGSDSDNFLTFILVHLIALTIFSGSALILIKNDR